MPLNPATYKAAQDRVELISRLILDTPDEQLADLVEGAETAGAMGPFLDPTAWQRGHAKLGMVLRHARAIAAAKREIREAAIAAGEIVA